MGRKVRAPNMANPKTKPTALAVENTRLANSPRGITGSAARRSTNKNRTVSTAPLRPMAMMGKELHP